MSFLDKLGPVGGAVVGGLIAAYTGYTPAVGATSATAATAATVSAGAFAGASVGAQVQGQALASEQAGEMKKQAEIKSAVAGLAAQRGRSEILRRTRIARGQVEAQGAVTGTQASSQVVGGVAGLESTTASNIGFSQATSDVGQKLFQSGQKIFDLEKRKGKSDLVAGVSGTLFDIGLKAKAGQL